MPPCLLAFPFRLVTEGLLWFSGLKTAFKVACKIKTIEKKFKAHWISEKHSILEKK